MSRICLNINTTLLVIIFVIDELYVNIVMRNWMLVTTGFWRVNKIELNVPTTKKSEFFPFRTNNNIDTLFMTLRSIPCFLTSCLVIISVTQTDLKAKVYQLLVGRLRDCMCKVSSSEFLTISRVQKSISYLYIASAKIDTLFYYQYGGKMT